MTIVIYTVCSELSMVTNIDAGQILLGIISFFTVSLGGLALGLICGLACALITRFSGELRGEV